MPVNSFARPLSPSELVSRTLAGRYDLQELLDDGPLFATFRAQDRATNRSVVVKTLLAKYTENTDLLAALRTGVGDILSLSHIGIVRPSDVGTDDENQVAFFLVEEYVRGIDLRERIRRNAPLSHTVAVDVLINLCNALQYAAERNVFHGDIRPTHVMTGPESPIKLTAWGIAEAQSIAAGEDQALHQASAPYTAPEVWATGTPTASGDLYALGVILYEMLTGVLPFRNEGNALAIARRHATEPVPSPRDFQQTIPRALDGVTQKLLAKRPSDRYETPVELLTDLHTIRDALRFGRSLAWSPLDGEVRPTVPNAESIRPAFDDDGTAVMPVTTATKISKNKQNSVVESVVQPEVLPAIPTPPEGVDDVSASIEYMPDTDSEENETLASAIPVQKRKGFSFSWLLPLNLFLATIFVATCGYVVNLMFIAVEPPTDVIVPNLVGKSLTEAKALGTERKFIVDVVNEQFNDKYPEDTIYEMRPEPGRHIRENKKVTVSVSKGPRMVTVPDIYDTSFDKARQVLEKDGLRIGDKKYEWDVMTAKGNITQQVPPAGENRPRGTGVDLTISKGPEPVEPQGPVPGAEFTPEPTVSETESAENDKESSLTLSYDVPPDASTHVVRIDVTDSRGRRTLITETHNAGEKVPLDVTGYGKKITFRVYDNDILQQELTGPPWTGGGDKKP